MRKYGKVIICLLFVLLLIPVIPVSAADAAKISLSGSQKSEDNRIIAISCRLENGDGITNGKLRIYYEEDKVTLISQETGDALSGSLCEVNDCIDGNMPEGEFVAAFASADEISPEGELLNMKFQFADTLDETQDISFEVEVDKLAGDQGDLSAEVQGMTVRTGIAGEQENSGGADTSAKSDKNSDLSDETNAGTVSTGDSVWILPYLAVGLAALAAAVAAGSRIYRRKK